MRHFWLLTVRFFCRTLSGMPWLMQQKHHGTLPYCFKVGSSSDRLIIPWLSCVKWQHDTCAAGRPSPTAPPLTAHGLQGAWYAYH